MPRRLDAEEITRQLADLDGWSGDGDGLHRTVEAADFPEAIAIVDDLAEVAEEVDHHPDIDIRWRTLELTQVTHAAGGVTQLDIEMAHRIDAIVRAHRLAD
jgi:4a-hydroxytetrahydrobiopterin dehydratase